MNGGVHRVLATQGVLVVSVPNVRHLKVLLKIVRVAPKRSGGLKWMLLQVCSFGLLRSLAIYQYVLDSRVWRFDCD